MDTRQLLFLLRKAPYQSSHAIEAVESVLVAGVFEQDVSVLFKDDGVWQLLKGQDGKQLGTRTLGKVLAALPEYDVSKIFVCDASLNDRGLTPEDLVIPAESLSMPQQQALIANQDAVLND